VVTTTLPVPALAAVAPADSRAAAKQLYEEGKTAYRLGRFDEAVQKFEAAYASSQLPTILYNIGLSYERLYTTSNDVAHLRKAKVLLQNFLLETQKDSSLGDPTEIESQIAEVDAMIEEHEQREAERDAGLAAEREKAQKAQQEAEEAKARAQEAESQLGPQGNDPGAANRRAGRLALGLGLVAGAGAAVGGILFMLERNKFEDQLFDNQDEFEQIGCVNPSDNIHCDALDVQAGALDRNAVKANQLSLGIGLGAGVVGVALVGTGIGLMVKGHKRTKKWKGGSDVTIAPTRNGLVVSGRF
jgi:tetratricopeptide (TPR) repeat protein